MSSLSQVLSEYSVPLQIWLSPEARTRVAEILIPTMGGKAHIVADPLTQLSTLRGPAVLVITARELTGPDQESLRVLSERAHPGRSVLVGGTSDRDTLMDAINNWGVVRVVESKADHNTIVEAVRAAGVYLNREVAMETAIEDLDIETTMIDSAIDQLEVNQERTIEIDRTNIATTFTAGMIHILEKERNGMSSMLSDTPSQENAAIQQTIIGMNALADIIEKSHDHAIEKAAGLPPAGEELDQLVKNVCTLLDAKVAGLLGSGARCSVDPFALSHSLLSICRMNESNDLTSIDTHKAGSRAVVTMSFDSDIPEGVLDELIHNDSLSWHMLEASGCTLNRSEDFKSIELILPTQEAEHV